MNWEKYIRKELWTNKSSKILQNVEQKFDVVMIFTIFNQWPQPSIWGHCSFNIHRFQHFIIQLLHSICIQQCKNINVSKIQYQRIAKNKFLKNQSRTCGSACITTRLRRKPGTWSRHRIYLLSRHFRTISLDHPCKI